MDNLFDDVLPRFKNVRSHTSLGDTNFIKKTLNRDNRAMGLLGITKNEYRPIREKNNHTVRMRLKASGGGVALEPKAAYSRPDQAKLAPAPYQETRQHSEALMEAVKQYEANAREVRSFLNLL